MHEAYDAVEDDFFGFSALYFLFELIVVVFQHVLPFHHLQQYLNKLKWKR